MDTISLFVLSLKSVVVLSLKSVVIDSCNLSFIFNVHRYVAGYLGHRKISCACSIFS